jgi:hypothetical protein
MKDGCSPHEARLSGWGISDSLSLIDHGAQVYFPVASGISAVTIPYRS